MEKMVCKQISIRESEFGLGVSRTLEGLPESQNFTEHLAAAAQISSVSPNLLALVEIQAPLRHP